MKILSFQHFSLFGNSGGSRILRRLYDGHEPQIFSITTTTDGARVRGNIDQKFVELIPLQRSWMRWKLRDGAKWLREVFFKKLISDKIKAAASNIQFDVLHIVDHGPYTLTLCNESFLAGRPLWVSFHDHFKTNGASFDITNTLWNMADRRLVISNEIGNEYQRLFGQKGFEIITDGVYENEISMPLSGNNGNIIVYFAGLLHIEYLPLFKVLSEALDLLAKEGLQIKLVLRGTQEVDFLNQRHFEVEYRPITNNYDELKSELDLATILYLPIKFTIPDFYLYSLSTKMVGYLGGSGPILFHGPADSAAGNLLKSTGSAVSCNTLDINDMVNSLRSVLDENCKVSFNAKIVAKNQFNMQKIKKRFWQSDSDN